MTTALSPQRLWFGLLAAPAAWAIHGLIGWYVGAQVCTTLSIGRVRSVVAVASLVMFAVACLGLIAGMQSWREASARRRAAADRVEFMALGGVLVSAAFVVGIGWAGLSAVFLDVCGGMR